MEKLKKALGVTVTYLLIIAVSVAASLVVRLAVREMRSEPASGLDMSEAANQLNTMAPMMVDEETELMNALGIEGLLVYNYRLVNVDQGTSANVLRRVIANDLRPDATRQACSTPELIALFERGGTLRYVYHYSDRTYISSFDVAPGDCGL